MAMLPFLFIISYSLGDNNNSITYCLVSLPRSDVWLFNLEASNHRKILSHEIIFEKQDKKCGYKACTGPMHICLYDRFTSLGTNSDGIYMKNLHMYVCTVHVSQWLFPDVLSRGRYVSWRFVSGRLSLRTFCLTPKFRWLKETVFVLKFLFTAGREVWQHHPWVRNHRNWTQGREEKQHLYCGGHVVSIGGPPEHLPNQS